MSDEKIIINFLEKNYKVVTTQSDFAIADINTEQTFNVPQFSDIFKKIIGNYTTQDGNLSIDIFNTWFNQNKLKITKKLTEYFDTMDGNLGSSVLSQQLFKPFELDSEFHHAFILNYFNDYYCNKFMIPKITDYIGKFDRKKFSNDLVDEFHDSLIIENMFQYEFAKNYLNNWYIDEVLEEKVNDMLSQFVVTLGRTNWVVTWIGHGPITEETLRKYFIKESKEAFNYIMRMFANWYDKTIIEMSEKAMRKVESQRVNSINKTLSRYL